MIVISMRHGYVYIQSFGQSQKLPVHSSHPLTPERHTLNLTADMVAVHSILPALALAVLANAEWYVVGVKNEWSVTQIPNGVNYVTNDYSIAAMNMDSGDEDDANHSGWGRGRENICGTNVMDAEVWCWGDVTKNCQGYIAAFKSRRCRTFCESIGDQRNLYNWNAATSGAWFRADLVCDRPYP